jgi:serine protease Do
MLPQTNKLQALLLSSALLTTLVPIAPASSQVPRVQQLQITSTQSQKMSASNLLAENTKSSVVRVVIGCKAKVYLPKNGKIYDLDKMIGHGSGFFVNSNGYIVTNAHVTNITTDECKQYLATQLAVKLQGDGEDLEAVEQQLKWIEAKPTYIVNLPNGELLPFQILKSGATFDEGKDVSIIKINVRNAPVLKLADSSKVQLLDKVTAVGYPGLVEMPNIFDETSLLEATFTSGEVSAIKTLKDNIPVIQVSAPAAPGNSGGPVLNERGEVIGIVTFGFSNNHVFLFTSNTVQEFLTSLGITNEEGLINQKYREGLQLYNQGKYTQALRVFQLVKRLFPYHSEVDKFCNFN